MIRIEKIQTEENNGKIRLIADIFLPNDTFEKWEKNCCDPNMKARYHREFADSAGNWKMWYEVDQKYEKMLCAERADAFVVACLYYAMVTGEDIQCKVPVTERLLYQLNEYIVPSLCQPTNGYKRIHVMAEPVRQITPLAHYVGTGVSCGVDSFSSIVMNMKESVPQSYRLTHLTLFNTGSMNFAGYSAKKNLEEWNRETDAEFEERVMHGKKVASELGLDFIAVNTNIADLYQGCFLYSHTFRNCSVVLALQKMWKAYYYASAGEPIQTNAGLTRDNAEYDLLALPGISLDSLTFYSGCLPYQRMEKTALIADNPVVQKYLNVCSFETKNCGKCEKCLRTITALDLMGKLDSFQTSFEDLSFYMANKSKLRAVIMESKPENPFLYEQRQYMERNEIHLDGKALIYHYLLPMRKVWKWLHEFNRG